jgi:hypothetical protein
MKLRVWLTDFWIGFDMDRDLPLLEVLRRHYDVLLTPDDPDVVIASDFGREHLRYDCLRIHFSGENTVTDFNVFDYGIGEHRLDFGGRYLYYPYFLFHQGAFDSLGGKAALPDGPDPTERKFCCFVYSNGHRVDPIRDRFFHRLSEYKKVDSGGRHLNNIGGPVEDKHAFMSGYKFSLAFENSSAPGYITEKLPQAMAAGTIPVYWGDPTVDRTFNPRSFIWLRSEADIGQAVERIIELDNDPEKYRAMLHEPWLNGSAMQMHSDYHARLDDFLCRAVESRAQGLTRQQYGWTWEYARELQRLVEADRQLVALRKKIYDMKHFWKYIFGHKRDKYF